MMWKESYRIGVERIDQQHRQLFQMVAALLAAIDAGADSGAFRSAIVFMKNYVAQHFHDEEAFQESIRYAGIEEHRREHRDFTASVLEYEKMLERSDYDIRVVKDFAGTLTAWLIYHVAGADQEIVRGGAARPEQEASGTHLECLILSLKEVLEKMAGLDVSSTPKEGGLQGDVFAHIHLTGDVREKATVAFNQDFAFELMRILTFSEPSELDEMVCSALAEVTNIAGGNMATALAKKGLAVDITTPELTFEPQGDGLPVQGAWIETGIGRLAAVIEPEASLAAAGGGIA